MRIVARRTLLEFVASRKGHKDQSALKATLDAWFAEARQARWKNSSAIRLSYATASFVGSDRVVFNIKGNDYRLIAAIDYGRAIVCIKWIGTHAEYDKIDARTVQYGD
jgi:mRNA interferase HigB